MPLYRFTEQENGESLIDKGFSQLVLKLLDDTKDRNKHDTYIEAVNHADEMSVHLYGKKPEKLLNVVRPREDQETKTYRLAAYQATTKATAGKALSVAQKIFNPTLYNIQWPKEESAKELQKYTEENYPKYNSVIEFLQKVALKKMMADPNGVMAVTVSNANIPDDVRPEAIVKLYGSRSLWWYDDNMFLFFKRKERAMKGGDIFYFDYYDNEFIVEFSAQKISLNNISIIQESIYRHNCGSVPAWFLSGVPEVMDNGIEIYKSFFEPAVPFWNLAITHESDLFGAYINHLHPIRTELAEECDYIQEGQKCKRGTIHLRDGGALECPSCHGSGLKSVKSPYGVYRYNKEKLSEGTATLEPVTYVTVPTEPTKMLEERVEKQHLKGLYALNMDILDKVGENQSGVAKVIDRGELYDFLYNISSVMFDVHLENIFYYFNKIMFGVSDLSKGKQNEKNLPVINKPVQFDISSAMEMMEQLKMAKEAGLNPQYMREKQKGVNDKEFANDPELKRLMGLMIELDPCPEYSVEELDLLGGRSVPKKFIVIHHNIEYLVEQAIEKDGEKFFNLPKNKQFEVISKLADDLIEEEIDEKLDTSAIETEDANDNTPNPSGAIGEPSPNGQPAIGQANQGGPSVVIKSGGSPAKVA